MLVITQSASPSPGAVTRSTSHLEELPSVIDRACDRSTCAISTLGIGVDVVLELDELAHVRRETVVAAVGVARKLR